MIVNEIDDGEQLSSNSDRHRAMFGLALLVAVVIALVTLPINDWLELAAVWIEDNALLGRFLFVAGAVLLTTLMVPGSIIMLSGGFLFGLQLGLPLVSISIGLGALAGGLISRTLARDWLAARFENDPRFKAIDRAVEKKGFLIVFLSRLSLLMPYNLLNLLYGLSGISLSRMALASWLGMTPAVILYTYLGSIAGNFDELVSKQQQSDWVGQLIFFSGIAMVAIVTYVIHRTATRELKRELESDEP